MTIFKNWEKGLTWNQFWARTLAEGYPDDPDKAHAELDKAYEVIAEDETQYEQRDAD